MVYKTTAILSRAPKEQPTIEEILLDHLRSEEAVVEIHAVGICHADLAVLHGAIPLPFPRVLGHEGESPFRILHASVLKNTSSLGSGIVKEVGAAVNHVQPGDKVILSFNPCGNCGNCENKLPSYCYHLEKRLWSGVRQSDSSLTLKTLDGKSIYGSFFGQSSFSRLALVDRSCLVKVPQTTDLKLFAPLACGIQTGTGAVWNTLDVQKGDFFIVAGCGAVGMSAVMAARERGAAIIIAVDIKEDRLTLAKELGATHAVNGLDDDIIHQIRTICPLPTGVHHALDTTAVPKVIESMLDATGVRGKTVVVGATPLDQKIGIQPTQYLNMGKRLIGSVEGDSYPPESIPHLIEHHQKGNLPLEKIVSYYKFEDFARAFEDMQSGKAIKPVLVWM